MNKIDKPITIDFENIKMCRYFSKFKQEDRESFINDLAERYSRYTKYNSDYVYYIEFPDSIVIIVKSWLLLGNNNG